MKSLKRRHGLVGLLALLTAILGLPAGAEPRSLFDLEALDCVIDPSQVSDLGSGVPGLLRAVQVDRSDFVSAGEVVAQLDSGVETAAVALAKARAELTAEVELRRVNAAFGKRQEARSDDLFRKKVISENDMDQRQTETRIAQLQLLQAMDNQRLAALELTRAEELLQRRTIRTPISGVVMERFKSAGEYVDDQPVLRVAQLDPLHVEVILPVEVLGQVEPGMQAEVWSEAVGDQMWHAAVSRIDRVADAASGTYGVRLTLPNPDYQIPAGLRCQMRFVTPTGPQLRQAQGPTPTNAQNLENATTRPDADELERGSERTPAVSARPAPQPGVEDHPGFGRLAEQQDAPVETPPLCQEVGPIEDRAQAEQLFEQLSAMGLEVAVAKQKTKSLRGFQVASASQPSFAKAKGLLNRLRAAGVEDTAIMRGRGRRWEVSLGLYRHKRYAKARMARLAAKGFEALIRPWTTTQSTYVLAVSGRMDERAADLVAAFPQAAVEPAGPCEQFASR